MCDLSSTKQHPHLTPLLDRTDREVADPLEITFPMAYRIWFALWAHYVDRGDLEPEEQTCNTQQRGMWRSLVAHLLWEQGVAGSNPAIPTI